jgi:hypothetical protein
MKLIIEFAQSNIANEECNTGEVIPNSVLIDHLVVCHQPLSLVRISSRTSFRLPRPCCSTLVVFGPNWRKDTAWHQIGASRPADSDVYWRQSPPSIDLVLEPPFQPLFGPGSPLLVPPRRAFLQNPLAALDEVLQEIVSLNIKVVNGLAIGSSTLVVRATSPGISGA